MLKLNLISKYYFYNNSDKTKQVEALLYKDCTSLNAVEASNLV